MAIGGPSSLEPAAAAISIVDGAITPVSSANNPTTFSIPSFTVSSSADVLIVEVGTRGVSGSSNTITYAGQTLTLAVQQPSVQTVFRDSAIYYLYNPTPGTAALSGQFLPTGISDYVLSAFTLGGVDTSISPITTGADGQTSATTTATLTAAQAATVLPGSFAAMEQTLNGGSGPFTYSATAAGNASGTGAELWEGTSGANILAAGGGVSALAAGTDTYVGSAVTNTNSKNPLAVAIFSPITSFVWVGGSSSDWATGTNWQGGSAPNGASQTATFGNASSNPSIALVNSGETVGGITFNGSVNATVSGPNTLALDNGAAAASIAVNGGMNAINAPIVLNSNLAVSAIAGSQLTIGGSIAENGGAKSLSFAGPGTLVLAAANSFSGGAVISSGTVRAGNANSLRNSTVTINSDNGLAFGTGVATFNLGGLAGSGALTLADTASAPVPVNVGGNNASTAYSGPLGGAGSLNKVGAGTLILSGASTYSGGTTITAGVLSSTTAGSLGAGPVTLAGGTLRAVPNPAPLLAGFGGTSSDTSGTGTGWTVNNLTITSNPINNNVLTLTDNAANEARSAFVNTPQPIAGSNGGFVASFTYQAGGNMQADGVVFMLQNDSRGLSALGGNGGGLGYTAENGGVPIQPSIGIAINIYNNHTIGTNLLTNGNANGDVYLSTLPNVDPTSGDPIAVTVAYNPTTNTVTETLTDTVTNGTFSTQYTGIDLASILGAGTALVGFSGATGGLASTQTISNFTYGAESAYANTIVLPGGATGTIDAAPGSTTSVLGLGPLVVGSGAGSTLNVTATTMPADTPYMLTLGTTTLGGNLTVNVANDGAGAGTVQLGAVGDGGAGFGITKTGPGILVLAASNTYQGPTTVTAGTLQLVGATGNNIPNSPTITVGSGAILDVTGLAGGSLALGSSTAQILSGHGSVNGAVSVNSGSTISGASGGPLTITGGLALQNGSISSFVLGAPNGSGNPSTAFVNVTGGTFGISGSHIVNLSGAAQAGTYELFAFTNGAPSAGQFALGTTAGTFLYAFNVVANSEVDLVVSPRVGSATWNLDGNGNYSDFGKWSPTVVPNGATLTATFGNGGSNTVGSSPALTVLVDAPATAGSLVFNNTNGTSYIVGNDFVTGHSLTLDNGGNGASVAVSATAQQQIQANLVLADNATFNIAPTSSLLVTVGSMSESGGSRSVTLSGGGTLTIDTPSGYTGGTTITSGTLTTTPTGTIGNGPLSLTASGGAAAVVNLGNDQTITSLSGTVSSGGSATVRVGAGTTLTVNQATASTFVGTLVLQSSASAHAGGTLRMNGSGSLEVQGAPSLGDNSNVQVAGGTLRFNATIGTATVGAGVLATISGSAMLELAGSVSALSQASGGRADVVNNSTAAAGLHVTGSHQQVGGIDGSGTTQVEASSDLTANHIVQAALLIGGDATHPALVTIAASDATGNPLGVSSSFAVTGSLGSDAQLSSESLGPSSITSAALDSSATRSRASAAQATAVPEPSAILLVCVGLSIAGLRMIISRAH